MSPRNGKSALKKAAVRAQGPTTRSRKVKRPDSEKGEHDRHAHARPPAAGGPERSGKFPIPNPIQQTPATKLDHRRGAGA